MKGKVMTTMMKILQFVIITALSSSLGSAEEINTNLRGSIVKTHGENTTTPEGSFERTVTQIKIPVKANNDIHLQGYSVESGSLASPFENIATCEFIDDEDTTTACLETIPSSDTSSNYFRTTSNSNTRENLLSTIVSAEGGAFGVSVSASAEYVEESTMSQDAVSHTIGSTVFTHKVRVRNALSLKLTNVAKGQLETNPNGFLNTYGRYFTFSTEYGGSFMGSFDLYSSSSTDSNDLSAEASFKYEGGVYSAAGSAKFTERVALENKDLQIESDYNCRPKVNGAVSTPADLKEAYDSWSTKVSENPVPIYIHVSNWYNSLDVQEALSGASSDVVALFANPPVLSRRAGQQASFERLNAGMMLKGLDIMNKWEDIQGSDKFAEWSEKVSDLWLDTERYTVAYEKIDDIQLLALDAELLNGNTDAVDNIFNSWLMYRNSFKNRYDDLVDEIPTLFLKYYSYFDISYVNDGWTPSRFVYPFEYSPLPSNTYQDTDDYLFCATNIPTFQGNAMKEFFISESNYGGKYLQRVSSTEKSSGNYEYDSSFFAYTNPQPNMQLRKFFIVKQKNLEDAFYNIHPEEATAIVGRDWYDTIEFFFAPVPDANGNC